MDLKPPEYASDELVTAVRLVNQLISLQSGERSDGKLRCKRYVSGVIVVGYSGPDIGLTSQLAEAIEAAGYFSPSVVELGVVTFTAQLRPRTSRK